MVVLYFSPSNSLAQLVGNLTFTANLPPARLLHAGDHLWSLCVEMQFYVGVAVLVSLAGRRGIAATSDDRSFRNFGPYTCPRANQHRYQFVLMKFSPARLWL